MYADPSKVRTTEHKLRLTESELALLQTAANVAGKELAAYCRDVILARIGQEVRALNIGAVS